MRPIALLLVLGLAQAAYGQTTVLIEVSAPGRSPRIVEQTVLAPLEKQLIGTEGVRRMRGLALDGRCLVRLDLAEEADPQLVGMAVQNRVALARANLPPGCTIEIVPPSDSAFMLMSLQPAPDMALADVTTLVKKTVWPRLAKVPGVTHIRLIGASEEGIRIYVNPDRLRAYNVALAELVAALQPPERFFGNMTIQEKKVFLKKPEKVEDLRNTVIISDKSVYLRDLAEVRMENDLIDDARISYRYGAKDENVAQRRAVFVLVQLAPGKLNSVARKGLEKAAAELAPKLFDVNVLHASRLLRTDDTTVVMRFPNEADIYRRSEKADAVVKAMMKLPQVDKVFWIVRRDDREVFFYVMSHGGKKTDLHKSLRATLAKIEGASSRVGGLYSPLLPWPGQGAPFAARLAGKDLVNLQKTAEQLRQRLSKTAGMVDVDYFPSMRQEVAIEVNRDKAAVSGVSMRDIATTLSAQTGSSEVPILGWPLHVSLQVPNLRGDAPGKNIDELSMLPIRGGVVLRDVATIRTITAPSGILHEEGKACVIVFGNLEGRTLDDARTEVWRIAQQLAGKDVNVEVE